MGIPPDQFREMLQRVERNSGRLHPETESECPTDGAEREIEGLHEPLMKWCKDQVPAVPYIRARSDQPSTIGEGIQDFTIFYRKHVICIEWKSRTGKVTTKQLGWKLLMKAQGFIVHEWRSMEQFHAHIAEINAKQTASDSPSPADRRETP